MSADTLNARPACDPHTGECYVRHGCGYNPMSEEVRFSILEPPLLAHGALRAREVSRSTLPEAHSPAFTNTKLSTSTHLLRTHAC